ncbi:12387_t:CDS:2, partial [Dentiscutata heterogama]
MEQMLGNFYESFKRLNEVFTTYTQVMSRPTNKASRPSSYNYEKEYARGRQNTKKTQQYCRYPNGLNSENKDKTFARHHVTNKKNEGPKKPEDNTTLTSQHYAVKPHRRKDLYITNNFKAAKKKKYISHKVEKRKTEEDEVYLSCLEMTAQGLIFNYDLPDPVQRKERSKKEDKSLEGKALTYDQKSIANTAAETDEDFMMIKEERNIGIREKAKSFINKVENMLNRSGIKVPALVKVNKPVDVMYNSWKVKLKNFKG